METQKCELCKKEIKGKCYIITEPNKDSCYMTSEENLIGKFICDDDAYEDDGQQLFSTDIDGSILALTKKNNGLDFYFKGKIVANNFQGEVSNEELKEICDIVKNIDAKEINGLEKAITLDSVDIESDVVANSLHNLLNHWKKKSYIAIISKPGTSKIEMYVSKEDKEEFVKLANEKMKSILPESK